MGAMHNVPPLDRNPLLAEGLLCPIKPEEKETSAPIYGELGEVRLGGTPTYTPTAVQGHQDSASHAGLNDNSGFAQHHSTTSAPSHWTGIETEA